MDSFSEMGKRAARVTNYTNWLSPPRHTGYSSSTHASAYPAGSGVYSARVRRETGLISKLGHRLAGVCKRRGLLLVLLTLLAVLIGVTIALFPERQQYQKKVTEWLQHCPTTNQLLANLQEASRDWRLMLLAFVALSLPASLLLYCLCARSSRR